MNLAEKIHFLMEKNNIKNTSVLFEKLNEKNLKIPYTTLLTIVNDEVQDIKLGTAKKLTDFFYITLDELLDDEINLADSYKDSVSLKGLTSEQKDKVIDYIELLKNQKS